MRIEAEVMNGNPTLGSTAARPGSGADLRAGDALSWESSGSHADAAKLADRQLESEIVDLVGRLSSGTYDLLVLIGELDARGLHLLQGALSCAAWLADRCDVDLVTAHNQVRVARTLRTYLVLDVTMASGDVSQRMRR